MTTSANTSFPSRLTKIDELSRGDHYHLDDNDECYFFGEYTARADFSHSATNQLIRNFKKKMDRKDKPFEWKHKIAAINQAALLLKQAINVQNVTFVPVPPSKAKSDAMHDDRLFQTLKLIGPGADVRDLVIQTTSTVAAHEIKSGSRPRPQDLISIYTLDQNLIHPIPNTIIIFDDVLTTGCHFKAVKTVLRTKYPEVQIIGVFLSRRAPEATDFADLV